MKEWLLPHRLTLPTKPISALPPTAGFKAHWQRCPCSEAGTESQMMLLVTQHVGTSTRTWPSSLHPKRIPWAPTQRPKGSSLTQCPARCQPDVACRHLGLSQAGALALQVADGLLSFPGREELLRHHPVEEKTHPNPLSSPPALCLARQWVKQGSAPSPAPQRGASVHLLPQPSPLASSLLHLPHYAPGLF